MKAAQLKEFLDYKVEQYNTPDFIHTDPIQLPHQFTGKEDKEISGFLTATISSGNRKSILRNANNLMDLMGNSPYRFVMEHSQEDLEDLKHFVHRTFNGTDLACFIRALKNIYTNHEGMEATVSLQISKGYRLLSMSLRKFFSNFPMNCVQKNM